MLDVYAASHRIVYELPLDLCKLPKHAKTTPTIWNRGARRRDPGELKPEICTGAVCGRVDMPMVSEQEKKTIVHLGEGGSRILARKEQ
jgi:hypothetical protein